MNRIALRMLLAAALLAVSSVAQGPGSCGFHLDLIADLTSTHSAVADLPGAPGSPFGIAPGAPGNPYQAWATPGTVIRLRLSIPAGLLGPTPIGPGTVVTILAAVNAPTTVIPAIPGSVAPCQPGQPWIISVLPVAGAVVDGLGFAGPAPFFPPADPGFPGALEVAVTYPAVLGGVVVTFQAAMIVPGGALAISNGVSLAAGASPHEMTLFPAITVPCAFGPLDEGGATVPTPPGFHFYGRPTNTAAARTNGYVELGADQLLHCDFAATPAGAGCVPTHADTSARVDVNHGDYDLGVPLPGNLLTDLTVETAPPTGVTPSRTIIRWKHAPWWADVPGSPSAVWTSMCCELMGTGGFLPAGTVVVVRQETSGSSPADVNQPVGIGPGDVGSGCGGPASSCTLTDYWNQWGNGAYGGAAGELIYNTGFYNYPASTLVRHLAVVFAPTTGAGTIPGSYSLAVY